MFENYPKSREPLPQKYKEIYASHYKKNREGETTATGLAQKMEKWLHKKVAEDIQGNSNKRTLEIGAGTLNQLQYEPESQNYDIIEPFKELYENSPRLKNVNNIYSDINEVSLDEKYDRITSIATFEHILNLPEVVAKTCLLLNHGGTLRTSIPNEGTILWYLGWKLTTGIEFKLRYNLNYKVLMKYEHVNTAKEIEEVLKYFYQKNSVSCFGLNKKLAFYRFYESSQPNIQLAQQYLKKS